MRKSVLGRLALVVVAAGLTVYCGGSKSPTSPTPPATPTRVISLNGNLAFGDVAVGGSSTATLTISNTGTSALNVTGMTVTGGLASHVSASWTSGSIPAGGSQHVTIEFSPASAGSFSGTLTVTADQTSGTNTIPISGTGVNPNTFNGNWSGRYVVERCDGTGSVQDLFCSANRGLYPVGTSLPLTLNLTQNGRSVSGTVVFGSVPGTVSGDVSNGALSLQGTAGASGLTITITGWNSTVSGSRMEGTMSYNVSTSSMPGVAAVSTRLSGVAK